MRCNHQYDGRVFTLEVTSENRGLAKTGNFTWQRENEVLSCHRGIWDEGLGFPESSKANQVSKVRRNGNCYFFAYRPGTMLPAAEKLFESAATKALETQKYRLAIYGLALVVLGLLVKLVLDK